MLTLRPLTKRSLVRNPPMFYRNRLLTSVAGRFAVGRRWLSTPFVVWIAKLTFAPSGPSGELWLPRKRSIKRDNQQLRSSNIRDMLHQVRKSHPLRQTQARIQVRPPIEEPHILVGTTGDCQVTRRNQHLYRLCPITLPPCRGRASRAHPRHRSDLSFPYMIRRLRNSRSCHNHLGRALLAQSNSSQSR
jgi:hypothetical protein